MTIGSTCEMCGASVRELRRGRCWGCYSRWAQTRPVGLGATCRMCGERRRTYLKSQELLSTWVAICHGCAARLGGLSPLPQTLTGIREALARDRRRDGRRIGEIDGRVWPTERRGGDRRALSPARAASAPWAQDAERDEWQVDDEMIVEIAELASELEALAAELPGDPGGDLTQIRDLSLGR